MAQKASCCARLHKAAAWYSHNVNEGPNRTARQNATHLSDHDMHCIIPASWCRTVAAREAVIELFLIPLLVADAFQLREPRSRRPAQHPIRMS